MTNNKSKSLIGSFLRKNYKNNILVLYMESSEKNVTKNEQKEMSMEIKNEQKEMSMETKNEQKEMSTETKNEQKEMSMETKNEQKEMSTETKNEQKGMSTELKSSSRLIEKTAIPDATKKTQIDEKNKTFYEAKNVNGDNPVELVCNNDKEQNKMDGNLKSVLNEISSKTFCGYHSVDSEGTVINLNEHLSLSETAKANETVDSSVQNDPSVILGAACVFTNNIPELIKDTKKNTKTTGTFDVFIVNDEGKINSYEINHYVEDDLNNQLYSKIKTPAEKKLVYQEKLRKIVNEIKNTNIEPIKESQPTILEISHYNTAKNNALVICYCGHGIQSEDCNCVMKNQNEDSEEQKFSSCSSISNGECLLTKGVFDSSSSEKTESSEIESREKSIDNKHAEKIDNDSLNTVLNGDRMSLHLVEEKVNKSQLPNLDVFEDKTNDMNQELEMMGNKEDIVQAEKDVLQQMVNNLAGTAVCSTGTDTLADVLGLKENELVVNELIDHNTQLMEKENVKEESISSISLNKSEPGTEEDVKDIMLQENVIVENLSKSHPTSTESTVSKISELSDYYVKSLNLESNAEMSEKFKDKNQKSSSSDALISQNTLNNENDNTFSTVREKIQKILPLLNKQASQPELTAVDKNEANLSTVIYDKKKLSRSTLSKQKSTEPSTLSDVKKAVFTTTSKEKSNENSSELAPENTTKSEQKVYVYAPKKDSEATTESQNASVLTENEESNKKSRSTFFEESANYVEVEIHLSEQSEQRNNEEIEKTVELSPSSSSQSTITFIENDKENYSQTLQNIRKNRVGRLVKFYEELDKKSKENR